MNESIAITGPLKTSLSRGWVVKSLLIIVVFIGLAIWGYVDATVLYPARGQKHVDHSRLGYLTKLEQGGASRLRNASVEDPASELARIKEQSATISEESVDAAKFQWLLALSRIENLGRLAETNAEELARREAGEEPRDTPTLFANPREHLRELESQLAGTEQPKPLNKFDIPSQWAFVVVGLGGGIPMLLVFLVNATKTYRYVPDTKTLTLPGGTDVTPDNLDAFDKRKWDKFLVFITLRGEDNERKVDLYRYTPLEDWLVEIYEASPIYEPDEDETPDDAQTENAAPDADTPREGDADG
ncbi:MAG: hypothetical protein AAGH64_09205 [Planctomycetota bacterium]